MIWTAYVGISVATCGELTLDNGIIEFRSEAGTTIATHVCNDGFIPVNGNVHLMCQIDGVWEGTSPICVRMYK